MPRVPDSEALFSPFYDADRCLSPFTPKFQPLTWTNFLVALRPAMAVSHKLSTHLVTALSITSQCQSHKTAISFGYVHPKIMWLGLGKILVIGPDTAGPCYHLGRGLCYNWFLKILYTTRFNKVLTQRNLLFSLKVRKNEQSASIE